MKENNGKYPKNLDIFFSEVSINFLVNSPKESDRANNLSYEKDFLSRFLAVLEKTGGNFWDVGAYVGVWSLLACKKVPACRVYSFEPEPSCREALKNNVYLNQLDERVVILPFAITETQDKISLFSDGIEGSCASVRNIISFNKTIQVDSKSVDNIVEKGLAPPPTIMKIDIEGAEILLIKGMNRYLPKYLFIELHPYLLKNNFSSSHYKMVDELVNRGYKLIWQEIRPSKEPRKDNILCHFELM